MNGKSSIEVEFVVSDRGEDGKQLFPYSSSSQRQQEGAEQRLIVHLLPSLLDMERIDGHADDDSNCVIHASYYLTLQDVKFDAKKNVQTTKFTELNYSTLILYNSLGLIYHYLFCLYIFFSSKNFDLPWLFMCGYWTRTYLQCITVSNRTRQLRQFKPMTLRFL